MAEMDPKGWMEENNVLGIYMSCRAAVAELLIGPEISASSELDTTSKLNGLINFSQFILILPLTDAVSLRNA